MNLIGNSCIPGYLYRDWFKLKYNNPFMWNAIDFDSFYTLAIEYDKLNFDSIKLERYSDKQNGYQIIVDNKVKVKYTHYIQDDRYKEPTTIEVDVHYNDIAKYILDKFKSRLERMKSVSERPTFILDASATSKAIAQYSEAQVQKFADMKIPYNKFLVIPPSYNIKYNSKNTRIYKFRSGTKSVNAKTIFLRNELKGWI